MTEEALKLRDDWNALNSVMKSSTRKGIGVGTETHEAFKKVYPHLLELSGALVKERRGIVDIDTIIGEWSFYPGRGILKDL